MTKVYDQGKQVLAERIVVGKPEYPRRSSAPTCSS